MINNIYQLIPKCAQKQYVFNFKGNINKVCEMLEKINSSRDSGTTLKQYLNEVLFIEKLRCAYGKN